MTLEIDLIKYRRERAVQTLEDARFLFEGKRLSFTVNRIYFALFYEVIALLKTKNLSSSKHAGVRRLFNKHFVKTGAAPPTLLHGKPFSHVQTSSQKLVHFACFYRVLIKQASWKQK